MPLTPDEVAAHVQNAAIFADDGYEPRRGGAGDWPAGYEVLLAANAKLLTVYSHLATNLEYAWAAEKSAYRTAMDVTHQYHCLEMLASARIHPPYLDDPKPIAVRAAFNRDFISYAQPSLELNHIFVGRGFMV